MAAPLPETDAREAQLPALAAFPAALAAAPAGPRIVETFGLGPSILAAALVAYGGYFFVGGGPRAVVGVAEYGVLAGLFAGALVAAGYEVRRHRRRATIVAQGPEIGIYREGRLDGTTSIDALRAARFDQPVSIRVLLSMLVGGVALIGYGMSATGDVIPRLWDASPGVLLLLHAASYLRTSLLCASFRLPIGRARPKALFRRREFARLVADTGTVRRESR